jgi:hypothetical protein
MTLQPHNNEVKTTRLKEEGINGFNARQQGGAAAWFAKPGGKLLGRNQHASTDHTPCYKQCFLILVSSMLLAREAVPSPHVAEQQVR